LRIDPKDFPSERCIHAALHNITLKTGAFLPANHLQSRPFLDRHA